MKREIKEKAIKSVFFSIAFFSVLVIFLIFVFLFYRSAPAINEAIFGDINLLSTKWSVNNHQYGLLAAVYGSIFIALGALLISFPLGLGASIYLSELAPEKLRAMLKPVIELLAGIPSIVYGFIGAVILGKFIYINYGTLAPNSILAGMLILGIMALPIIVSMSDDALKSVPKDMKDASLALGATKWQTTKKVTIPSAISGITSATIMGMGRAIGETMAILMVVGSVMRIPTPGFDVFETTNTLTALIASQMGEAAGVHQSVLFAAAIMLFTIVTAMSIISDYLQMRTKRKFEGKE